MAASLLMEVYLGPCYVYLLEGFDFHQTTGGLVVRMGVGSKDGKGQRSIKKFFARRIDRRTQEELGRIFARSSSSVRFI